MKSSYAEFIPEEDVELLFSCQAYGWWRTCADRLKISRCEAWCDSRIGFLNFVTDMHVSDRPKEERLTWDNICRSIYRFEVAPGATELGYGTVSAIRVGHRNFNKRPVADDLSDCFNDALLDLYVSVWQDVKGQNRLSAETSHLRRYQETDSPFVRMRRILELFNFLADRIEDHDEVDPVVTIPVPFQESVRMAIQHLGGRHGGLRSFGDHRFVDLGQPASKERKVELNDTRAFTYIQPSGTYAATQARAAWMTCTSNDDRTGGRRHPELLITPVTLCSPDVQLTKTNSCVFNTHNVDMYGRQCVDTSPDTEIDTYGELVEPVGLTDETVSELRKSRRKTELGMRSKISDAIRRSAEQREKRHDRGLKALPEGHRLKQKLKTSGTQWYTNELESMQTLSTDFRLDNPAATEAKVMLHGSFNQIAEAFQKVFKEKTYAKHEDMKNTYFPQLLAAAIDPDDVDRDDEAKITQGFDELSRMAIDGCVFLPDLSPLVDDPDSQKDMKAAQTLMVEIEKLHPNGMSARERGEPYQKFLERKISPIAWPPPKATKPTAKFQDLCTYKTPIDPTTGDPAVLVCEPPALPLYGFGDDHEELTFGVSSRARDVFARLMCGWLLFSGPFNGVKANRHELELLRSEMRLRSDGRLIAQEEIEMRKQALGK